MKARRIYGPNQPQSHKVVCNELLVILSWFFQTENEDKELLAPVGGLHEIVSL